MSRKDKFFGECNLCGVHAKLSFEHVPPRAAFNNRPIVYKKFEEFLNGKSFEEVEKERGAISQRGIGGFTLCEQCNNDTGAWYGDAFVEWAYQGLAIRDRASNALSLPQDFHIFPLRVLKQILCMFFSINFSGFRVAQPELVRLILNKNEKYLPSKIKIYAFIVITNRGRNSPVVSNVNIMGGIAGAKIFSEIAFPPIGYIMSLDSIPPDYRLTDISHFSQYGYNEGINISLKLPLLPVYSYLPGDYRDEDSFKNASTRGREYQEASPLNE